MAENAVNPSHARTLLLDAYRRESASEWIQASGGSMLPLVRPGTWMLVDFGAVPGRGEIVLFHRNGAFVAHRVVALRARGKETLLVTKGDAEPYREVPLEPEAVTGVVRGLAPSPDGAPVSLGCTGLSSRAIASISNAAGRFAALASRIASHLPDPARSPVSAAGVALARVAGRAAAYPVALAAHHSLRSDGRG